MYVCKLSMLKWKCAMEDVSRVRVSRVIVRRVFATWVSVRGVYVSWVGAG